MTAALGDIAASALSHDPVAALAAAQAHLAVSGHCPDADAVHAFALVLNCQFDQAAAWVPEANDPLTRAMADFIAAVCHAEVRVPADGLGQEVVDLGLHAFVSVEAAMSAGQIAQAEHAALELETVLTDLAGGTYWAWNQVALARSLVFQGRFTEARMRIERVLTDVRRERWPAVGRIARGVQAFIAAHEGDGAPSAAFASSITAELPDPQTYLESAAFILAAFAEQAAGRVEAVDALVLHGGGGRFLPRFQVVDRVYAFEMLVESALTRGELAVAKDWLDLAEAHAFAGHDMASAAVARCRARIAIAQDDAETGARESILSRERAAQVGGYLEVLRSQLLEAGAARAGTADSVDPADIEAVAFQAARTGAKVVRDWAVRELTLRGRRLRNVPGQGWEALTDRQRLVAVLAAQGLRNREIGAQLFVSERTVEGHIAAVLDALGAPSRVGIGQFVPRPDGLERSAVLRLTPRQRAVAELVAAGHSNAAIARTLGISEKTVEKHVSDLFARLQVQSRSGIAAFVRAS